LNVEVKDMKVALKLIAKRQLLPQFPDSVCDRLGGYNCCGRRKVTLQNIKIELSGKKAENPSFLELIDGSRGYELILYSEKKEDIRGYTAELKVDVINYPNIPARIFKFKAEVLLCQV